MKITLSFFLLSSFLLMMPAAAEDVTYDGRSLFINGRRHLIISASIHYPRSVPEMWPELVRLAKKGGANTIETYVYWNGHEIAPNVYNFEGRFDLVKFVKIVQEAGLFMILRIGPFVAGEWNFGGVPVWLHFIPGTFFRTDNDNYKFYMEKFMTYIVNLMKQEKLFASQAENGPIIMAQVENEFEFVEQIYPEGKKYVSWAAQMAVSQNIGVPWIMCREYDAPDPVIGTCNDYYCDDFQPSASYKPKIWTENWTGWLPTYWAPNHHRPSRDSAFAVARFFQKGGSVMNYYMYHGGTSFGRTGGGGFTTSYDFDGPIDEYGILKFPKWGHLKELHQAIKLCEDVILGTTQPTNIAIGPSQEAVVWGDQSSTNCAAFLTNFDSTADATIMFQNASYDVPAWSVSILPDCKNVVFNTAKVSSQSSVVEMVPEDLKPSSSSFENCGEQSAGGDSSSLNPLKWELFVEKAGIWGEEADLVYNGLVDQLNVTKDVSDYLWYTTSIDVDGNEAFMKDGSQVAIVIQFQSHHINAFVNGELMNKGGATGENNTLIIPVALKAGRNEISIFNSNVGLPSAGAFYEWFHYGPSNVKLEGFNNGTVIDLSTSNWSYKVGLEGEKLEIYKPESTDNVAWNVPSEVPKMQPLTWYKVIVEEPSGDDPIGLDMLNMGKGSAWLNGQQIGRYWLQRSGEHEQCVSHGEACDYRGYMYPDKCRTGCGEPTQRWYHIPRSWFKQCGNLLVIFEEEGGDPTSINFSKRRVSRVCGFVVEDHPPLGKATVHLKCPQNTNMSSIEFASFGTPTGNCGSFELGDYHDPNSLSVVEKACLGKNKCAIPVSEENFNKGTSNNTKMRLAVEAACGLSNEH